MELAMHQPQIVTKQVGNSSILFSAIIHGLLFATLWTYREPAQAPKSQTVFITLSGPSTAPARKSHAPGRSVAKAPRDSLAVPMIQEEPVRSPATEGSNSDSQETASAQIFAEGDLDSPPRTKQVLKPAYPARALRDGLEGTVVLSLVINAAGEVLDAVVSRSAGHGFDEAALEIARKILFEPALRHGHAVQARVSWTWNFRLD